MRILIQAIAMAVASAGVRAADDFAALRAGMIKEFAALTVDAGAETSRHAFDARIMMAMQKVPRHEFVPPERAHNAYENRPPLIGYARTISQPYIVALMTKVSGQIRGSAFYDAGIAAANPSIRLSGGYQRLKLRTSCPLRTAPATAHAAPVAGLAILNT